MAKTTLSVLLTVSVLLSAAFFASFSMVDSAHALKAKGSPQAIGAKAFGSKNAGKICGDKLCKEGKRPTLPTSSKPETTEPTKQTMNEPQSKPAQEPTTQPTTEPKPMTEKPAEPMMHTLTIASKTITSVQDPGLGHESHQLAVILPPSDKIYKGSITYSASEPVQLVALTGPLAEGEDKGQPIWTPDGKTKFALTLVDPQAAAGTWNFAGNALAIHTKKTDPFTVSYTVVASQ